MKPRWAASTKQLRAIECSIDLHTLLLKSWTTGYSLQQWLQTSNGRERSSSIAVILDAAFVEGIGGVGGKGAYDTMVSRCRGFVSYILTTFQVCIVFKIDMRW